MTEQLQIIPQALGEFFALLADEAPTLFGYLDRLKAFCLEAYRA